jgi:isopentenyl diphosphate isomerase/L-lactate dehydrogenase-like FMN-dependent dehydrogenase
MTEKRKALSDIWTVEALRQEALKLAAQQGDTVSPQRGSVPTHSASDRRSRDVFDRIFFKQQIIHDMAPSTEIEFLGYSLKTPIMIGPMRAMATFIEDGVGQMCTATHATGSMTWIASNPMEFYAQHASTYPLVYIEKPLADRRLLLTKLAEAERAGCIAVGVDVDSSGRGPMGVLPDAMTQARYRMAPVKSMSVEELYELQRRLSKPFVIKGVLSVDDAVKAVEIGADVIVVSNHYGVTLNYAQAPLEVLPDIATTVGDDVTIVVDCQMRMGADVLKALALGGDAVLVGRPILWGAQVGGSLGMAHVIQLMTEELRRAMLYTGVESVRQVPRDILVLPKTLFKTK